jgi:hypothetical protein
MSNVVDAEIVVDSHIFRIGDRITISARVLSVESDNEKRFLVDQVRFVSCLIKPGDILCARNRVSTTEFDNYTLVKRITTTHLFLQYFQPVISEYSHEVPCDLDFHTFSLVTRQQAARFSQYVAQCRENKKRETQRRENEERLRSLSIAQLDVERRKVASLIWRGVYQQIVNLCIALWPLRLPPYVLLEIFDCLGDSQYATHLAKINLVNTLYSSMRRITQSETQ